MSEFELHEIATNYQEVAISATGLYLSLISGYLLIAYFIGRDLTKVQLWILNVLFLVATFPTVIGGMVYTISASNLFAELNEAIGRQGVIFSDETLAVFGVICGIGFVSMIPAAYYFMWSTRKGAT